MTVDERITDVLRNFFDEADQLNERSTYTYRDVLEEATQAIKQLITEARIETYESIFGTFAEHSFDDQIIEGYIKSRAYYAIKETINE